MDYIYQSYKGQLPFVSYHGHRIITIASWLKNINYGK